MNIRHFGQAHAIGIDIGTSGVCAVADKLDFSSGLAQTGVQAHVSETAHLVQMREAQLAPRYLLRSFVWDGAHGDK